MSDWKECKLGDFAEIRTGPFGSQLHASNYVSAGMPSIMPTNIGNRLNIIPDDIYPSSRYTFTKAYENGEVSVKL